MRGTAGHEITARLAATEHLQAEHRRRGRTIDAAACEIRAQAFREALALLRGRALPALEMRQSGGERSAEVGPD